MVLKKNNNEERQKQGLCGRLKHLRGFEGSADEKIKVCVTGRVRFTENKKDEARKGGKKEVLSATVAHPHAEFMHALLRQDGPRV